MRDFSLLIRYPNSTACHRILGQCLFCLEPDAGPEHAAVGQLGVPAQVAPGGGQEGRAGGQEGEGEQMKDGAREGEQLEDWATEGEQMKDGAWQWEQLEDGARGTEREPLE